jgi:hypothetical protein
MNLVSSHNISGRALTRVSIVVIGRRLRPAEQFLDNLISFRTAGVNSMQNSRNYVITDISIQDKLKVPVYLSRTIINLMTAVAVRQYISCSDDHITPLTILHYGMHMYHLTFFLPTSFFIFHLFSTYSFLSLVPSCLTFST